MARSKVKNTYIEGTSARRTSFMKRSKNFLKKTSELSTRCDVQACSILYGPYSQAPLVWPSVEDAREVLTRFRNMPKHQQVARKGNQESFTTEQIKKQEENLVKYKIQNYRNDMTHVMNQRMRGEGTRKANLKDLLEMGVISDEKMKKIAERLEKIKLGGLTEDPNSSSNLLANPTDGNEALTNELVPLYKSFNWDDNLASFQTLMFD